MIACVILAFVAVTAMAVACIGVGIGRSTTVGIADDDILEPVVDTPIHRSADVVVAEAVACCAHDAFRQAYDTGAPPWTLARLWYRAAVARHVVTHMAVHAAVSDHGRRVTDPHDRQVQR